MGEIKDYVLAMAAFITGLSTIYAFIKLAMKTALKPLCNKIDKVDVHQCKSYLVDFLAELENGIKKDDCQIRRAYEVYQHYTGDLRQNSYVHDKWDRLMKKSKGGT